jgi:peptidoglycan/LPS O-acetylase OafA/YrhL
VSEVRPDPAVSASPIVAGYRPWLDGVRAVAVLLVVVQHTMGQIPLDLGSVGVGIFFALSGYLITSILLDEHALRGSVSLSGFYLRRAARLAPALLLVVLVCDVAFLFAGDHGPVKGSVAALTYTANYVQVLWGDSVPGFGPTWSLAVEEHFYILWPVALLWVTRRYGLRTALQATLAVCVAALLWRGALAALDVRYALPEIGSLERADALLYGCAAAIGVRLGWRPHPVLVWLGGAVVGSVMLLNENYPTIVIGQAALAVGAAAVVVGLDYAAPSWLRSVLSSRSLVTVGILSYGLYLWHGPMMRIAGDLGFAGRGWRAVAVLVSLSLAAGSHRYLETPVRAWARRRSRRSRDRIDEAASTAIPGSVVAAEV